MGHQHEAASAGFTELERYGEYLALHLGESLDGWWTHSHSCNKSEIRSLPHVEGKPDHDYPPYQISNGNQMVPGPPPHLAPRPGMCKLLCGARAGRSTRAHVACKALQPGAVCHMKRKRGCEVHSLNLHAVSRRGNIAKQACSHTCH